MLAGRVLLVVEQRLTVFGTLAVFFLDDAGTEMNRLQVGDFHEL